MSILSVDNISPIGSGTSVTVNKSVTLESGNTNITGVTTFASNINLGGDVIHSGDNTKIRFPANDTITFETSGSEKLRITSNGKVGIGTINPQQLLEVQDRSGGTLIGLSVGTQYGNAGFGGYNNYPAIMNNVANPLIYCDTNNDRTIFFGDTVGFGTTCAFRVNGAERLRIQSDGTLVTGAQTIPTSSDIGNIYIKNASAIGSPSHQINYVSNAVFNGSWKYITSGFGATQIIVNQSSISVNFAGSGTAGNNITFSEKLRIDSSGRLLVGRTNNISVGGDSSDHCFEQITNNGYTLTLHANQNNQRGLGIFYTSGKTPEAFMFCEVSGSNKFIILSSGNVINANNSYGQISDISLKENIVDAKSQWNDIKNIKIRNFNFKSSTGHDTHTQIGLVAQEVETVCPKLVDTNEDGKKIVTSSVLYMKAVKALQEAQARIETLEAEVAALKAK